MKPAILLLGLAAEALAAAVAQPAGDDTPVTTRTFELPTFTQRPPHWPTKSPTRTHSLPPHPTKTSTRTRPTPTSIRTSTRPRPTKTSTRPHPTSMTSVRTSTTRTRTRTTRPHPTPTTSVNTSTTRTRTRTRTRTNAPHPTTTKKPWPTYGLEARDVVDDSFSEEIVERDVDVSDKPDSVHIVGVTYGGTGCPQGSARTILSDDRETLTMIFDKYVAAVGPNVNIEDSRKNCQINLKLQYPGGYQYSVLGVDYRGYAKLDRGVDGLQKTNYYYSGETNDFSLSTRFVGPTEGDYFLHDESDQVSRNWSPCGSSRALNINSQVRLNSRGGNAAGILTNDSIDADFRQIFHIRWRKC